MADIEIAIKNVLQEDGLVTICKQMHPDKWGKDNDMSSYSPENLKKFLQQNGILLLAYAGEQIAGAALCYDLPHPGGEYTLYIHELDTHPDFRRQGVGTKLMEEAFRIGKERGMTEVWVSTETDNEPAKALYKKIRPYEIEPSVTYAYKVE